MRKNLFLENGLLGGNSGFCIRCVQQIVVAVAAVMLLGCEKCDHAVADFESHLSTLENRIQSIVFMSEYSDGKATFTPLLDEKATLHYLVSPAEAAAKLAADWADDNGIVKVFVHTVQTRAVGSATAMKVTAVVADSDGLLTVSVTEESSAPLPSGIWDGTQEGVVYVAIADGNNNITSEPVPVAIFNSMKINGASMTADALKTAVAQALERGAREFVVSGDLTAEKQKAVMQALSEWHNGDAAKHGTIDLTFSETTQLCERMVEISGDSYGAYALRSVFMPEAVSAGPATFWLCNFIERMSFPKLQTAGERCFIACGREAADITLEVPELKEIGAACFDEFGATSLYLPKLTTIGGGAFSGNKKLQSVVFGSFIENGGGNIFERSLTGNIDLSLKSGQTTPLTAYGDLGLDWDWFRERDLFVLVEAGEGKTFAGYTFKSITLVD